MPRRKANLIFYRGGIIRMDKGRKGKVSTTELMLNTGLNKGMGLKLVKQRGSKVTVTKPKIRRR